jgi:mercuric ion transport protein
MKTLLTGIWAALAASACCIGPVLFSLIGAGALSAAAVKLEPYRPWLIGLTVILLGTAFYNVYRPDTRAVRAGAEGACARSSKRSAKIFVWVAAIVAALLIAFPYYIGYLL